MLCQEMREEQDRLDARGANPAEAAIMRGGTVREAPKIN